MLAGELSLPLRYSSLLPSAVAVSESNERLALTTTSTVAMPGAEAPVIPVIPSAEPELQSVPMDTVPREDLMPPDVNCHQQQHQGRGDTKEPAHLGVKPHKAFEHAYLLLLNPKSQHEKNQIKNSICKCLF